MSLSLSESINRRINPKYEKLISEVLEKHLYPEDMYEIAAILEANGWTDDRVMQELGVNSIFELSEELWMIIRERITAQPFLPVAKMTVAEYLGMIARSFLRGIIFALPMAISVVAMLTLRFSLWSYLYLSLDLATAIAIGTIMSFMTVGGFTQAIARRGFLYIKMGYYNMARRITFFFIRLGYIVSSIVLVAYLLFNAFFGLFPLKMTIILIFYYIFLSAIWLSVTIMYILQKELAFTGLMAAGILLVYILFVVMGLNILVSQVISLCLVTFAGAMVALYFMKIAERKMEKGIAPALPRTSITIYTVLPYFIYGFLYFTFLFMDRILAWSTSNVYMPYLIWFRGPYELGLDFALITLILPMGFIEIVINEFMANMEAHQKNHLVTKASALGQKYLGIYLRRVLLVSFFSLVNAVFIYLVVRFIHLTSWFSLESSLLSNATTHFVFVVALIGYTLLCVGLMNALILFSVSQPEMVCQSILIALIVNILVGFVLSRWIDHSYAVIGMTLGALTFMVLSYQRVVKVLNNLDYYLYAAS